MTRSLSCCPSIYCPVEIQTTAIFVLEICFGEINTPVEQDVTYSGFDFIEFVSDFTDPETKETRALTDEEKKAMEREVIDWVKSEL